jgi:hypothetical protein
MPSALTNLLASPYFKYIVLALTILSHATALTTYLQADGHVQAATIVAACVAMAGHILQFLAASGVPGVTVSAVAKLPQAVARVQDAVDKASLPS